MTRPIMVTLAAALALGCDTDTHAPKPQAAVPATTAPVIEVTAADIVSTYKALRLMTPRPVLVDPELAVMCATPKPQWIEAARAKNGPHAATEINIYMNELAAAGFASTGASFPVGAVVVKEKTWLKSIGGMIKHAAGYDPEHDDWEFFFAEDGKRLEAGLLQSCIDCHAGATATDHVYGSWATK